MKNLNQIYTLDIPYLYQMVLTKFIISILSLLLLGFQLFSCLTSLLSLFKACLLYKMKLEYHLPGTCEMEKHFWNVKLFKEKICNTTSQDKNCYCPLNIGNTPKCLLHLLHQWCWQTYKKVKYLRDFGKSYACRWIIFPEIFFNYLI